MPRRHFNSFLLSLLALCLGCGLSRAADPGIDEDDADVKTLIYTRHFGFGPINADGQITEGEGALKRILKKDGAVKRLFPVIDHATLAGKCYALAGIRLLAPSAFDDFQKQLEPWNTGKVRTVVTGKKAEEKFADVVALIKTGLYNDYLTSANEAGAK
ncbi:MAG: hypothetical protein QM790_02360 [Nibricoccus sp.]